MKKILGISLVALFAVSPIMAKAAVDDPVAGQPAAHGAQADDVITTTATPKFAVATEAESDVNVASAGYVKGAYNAAIRAVNKVYDDLDDKIDSATLTEGSAIDIDSTNKINVIVDNSTISIGDSGVQIKDGGVDTDQLASGAVTSAKIDTDAVTSAAIATGAVGSDEIATSAVGSDEIANSSILVEDIATSAMAAGSGTYANSSALAQQGYVDEKIADLNIGNYATQSGVEQTIKNTGISITDNKTVSLSGGVTATGAGSIVVMNDWNNASSTTTHSYIGGVNNTLSAALSGTITAAVADSTVDYAVPTTE